MTAFIAFLGVCFLVLVVLVAVNLFDSPKTKTRAAVEARSYVPRPDRRRIPRTATFIVQPRHVTDPQPGVVRGGEVEETVIVFDTGLLARTEEVA